MVVDKNDETYAAGLRKEKPAMKKLSELYPKRPVRKATPDQDRNQDIDCWLGNIAISIKTENKAITSRKLAVELNVFVAGEGWKASWFFTCEAHYWLFQVGEELYLVAVKRIRDFVKVNGWEAVKQLTFQTQANQRRIRHPHLNADIGILPISLLLDTGLAVRLN